MKTCPFLPLALLFCTLVLPLAAQVPGLLNYQGRIAVGSINFDGNGQFKFALVNGTGSTTYWSNDGTSTAGSQPTAAVTLPVTKGLYSVQLGDTALANMTALPATVFANTDVRLRVWFNDGTTGFQLLTPDKRIAAVGYAMMAETVPDGAITGSKIAPGAITSSRLASGLTLTGNLTGNATNFTGPLMGDVTGTQSATVVSSVGGSSASNVNAATVAANSATSANSPGTLIKRDGSGNFAAGTMTGNITGSAASFTGALAGDVTGTQSATSISPTTVTGKTLVGFSSAPGAVTASDSILSALGKLNGNVATRAPLASPSFSGTITLPLGTASSAPLILQAGSNLTTPVFGAVEFDGSNVHVTNNSTTPTRKTLAFTDTTISPAQIPNGLVSSSMIANGAVTDQKVLPGIDAGKIASGSVSNGHFERLSDASVAATPNSLVIRNGDGAVLGAPSSWIFVDEKSSGSGGGSSSPGVWLTRSLNTVQFTSGPDCTLSGNQFTLQPGSYIIRASAPGHNINKHKIRLYNVTDNTVVAYGSSEFAGGDVQTRSFLSARVQPASAKTYRIEHYTGSNSSTGMGLAFGAVSATEVYTIVEIAK